MHCDSSVQPPKAGAEEPVDYDDMPDLISSREHSSFDTDSEDANEPELAEDLSAEEDASEVSSEPSQGGPVQCWRAGSMLQAFSDARSMHVQSLRWNSQRQQRWSGLLPRTQAQALQTAQVTATAPDAARLGHRPVLIQAAPCRRPRRSTAKGTP